MSVINGKLPCFETVFEEVFWGRGGLLGLDIYFLWVLE